jgi:hypothetical protein
LKKATKIYVDITKANWISYSLPEEGMTALVLNRFGEAAAAKMIIKSLKKRLPLTKIGVCIGLQQRNLVWYQAPIETQVLIGSFTEVSNDINQWTYGLVIKNKQKA